MIVKLKAFIKTFLIFKFSLFFLKNKNKFFGIRNGKDIDFFMDLGANVGNFPLKFEKNYGVKFKNVLFVEPDSRCLQDLKTIKNRCLFENTFIENCCIGDKSDDIEFHLTKDSAQNSILKPNFTGSETTVIKQKTGDSILENYKEYMGVNNMLKLDVQGYEINALNGLSKSLSNFKYIIIEVSHDAFYENQASMLDILRILDKTHIYRGDFSQAYNKLGNLSYSNSCFELKDA